MEKEHYYTAGSYQTGGLEPFLDHAREFLAGTRTIPVCRARCPGQDEQDVRFTFTVPMLHLLLDGDQRLLKAYEVALK